MSDEDIDISGLSKPRVLQALFNRTKQQGLGFLDPRGSCPMDEQTSRDIVSEMESDGYKLSFDYLYGRVMKVDITGDSFGPWLFDRDNGPGAAAEAIECLRGMEGVS